MIEVQSIFISYILM